GLRKVERQRAGAGITLEIAAGSKEPCPQAARALPRAGGQRDVLAGKACKGVRVHFPCNIQGGVVGSDAAGKRCPTVLRTLRDDVELDGVVPSSVVEAVGHIERALEERETAAAGLEAAYGD